MTDTVIASENTDTESVEESNEPTFKVTDELALMFVERINQTVGEYNDLANKIKANSGDEKSVTESVIAGDDPEIVKAREAAEKARKRAEDLTNALQEAAKTKALEILSASRDDAALKADQDNAEALLKRIKATQNMLKVEYPSDNASAWSDVKNGEANILDLVTNTVSTRTSSGAGKGTGVKRLRGFTVSIRNAEGEYVVSRMKNNAKELVSSFSAASKDIGCDNTALQQAYFAAVGTDDPEKFPVETDTDFTFDHDGKSFAVRARKHAKAND